MSNLVKIILMLVILPFFLIFLFSYRSSVLNRPKPPSTTQTGSKLTICSTVYEPVCGEDSITYSNQCRASLSHAQIAYFGVCKEWDSDTTNTISSSGNTGALASSVISAGSDSAPPSSSTASGAVSGEIVLTASLSGESTLEGTGVRLSTYYSIPFAYGFSIPLGDYYQWFGNRLSAIHTVAIKHKAPVDTFENADVRIYLFPSVLPELSQASTDRIDDSENGRIMIRLGSRSVIIESSDLGSATVMTILATINSGK